MYDLIILGGGPAGYNVSSADDCDVHDGFLQVNSY